MVGMWRNSQLADVKEGKLDRVIRPWSCVLMTVSLMKGNAMTISKYRKIAAVALAVSVLLMAPTAGAQQCPSGYYQCGQNLCCPSSGN